MAFLTSILFNFRSSNATVADDPIVDLDDELDGDVVEGVSSEREFSDVEEEGCSVGDAAEAVGYCGDRISKWLPPHNVPTGPRIVWARSETPLRALAVFLLFLSFSMMETIIENSNIYAVYGKGIGSTYMSQEHGCPHWRPSNVMDFRRFLASLLYMAIIKAPSRANYWQKTILFSGLLGSMFVPTYQRYCGILAALHCVNPDNEDRTDPLRKIKTFYDHMCSRCKELYTPAKCISIERMVKFKGRFFKQYIMNKPTKWGFKLWVLAD